MPRECIARWARVESCVAGESPPHSRLWFLHVCAPPRVLQATRFNTTCTLPLCVPCLRFSTRTVTLQQRRRLFVPLFLADSCRHLQRLHRTVRQARYPHRVDGTPRHVAAAARRPLLCLQPRPRHPPRRQGRILNRRLQGVSRDGSRPSSSGGPQQRSYWCEGGTLTGLLNEIDL